MATEIPNRVIIEVLISFEGDDAPPLTTELLDELVYQIFPFIGTEVQGLKVELGETKLVEGNKKASVTISLPIPSELI